MYRKNFNVLLLSLLPVFLLSASDKKKTEITATVVAEKINLRAGPGMREDIIGTAAEGTRLAGVALENGVWLKIRLPETSALWVHISRLNLDRTIAKGAELRSGPGSVYTLMGHASGEKVEVLEASRGGYWAKVRLPKESMYGYCHIRNLKLPENYGAILSGTAANHEILQQNRFQNVFEEKSSAEGELLRLPSAEKKKEIQYALIVRTGPSVDIRAYLSGDEKVLAKWNTRSVKVSGKKTWNKKWKRPLIFVENIEPVWHL